MSRFWKIRSPVSAGCIGRWSTATKRARASLRTIRWDSCSKTPPGGRHVAEPRPSRWLIIPYPNVSRVGWAFRMGGGCGSCVPEFAFGMGCSFRLRGSVEIASQYSVEKRDAASQRGRKRKPHPISQANAGTRFSEGYGLRTRWGCHKAAKRGLKINGTFRS